MEDNNQTKKDFDIDAHMAGLWTDEAPAEPGTKTTQPDLPLEVPAVRVAPLIRYLPYKWLRADIRTKTPARWDNPVYAVPSEERRRKGDKRVWAPGTVTAVVQKENDANCIFMLTVGHAFYDMDPNKSQSHTNDVQTGMVSNTLDFWWGEETSDLVEQIGPHSESYGQYYRMGDKLGSTLDCGLARLSVGVVWNNRYAYKNLKESAPSEAPAKELELNLRELDDKWPPPRGMTYRVREVTIDHEKFIFCDRFFSMFENWEGKNDSEIENAILSPRTGEGGTNKTSMWKGASGSALIRYDPDVADAIVVGIFLGSCEARIAPPGGSLKTNYDVFQHISVAKRKLGLAVRLPQPI